MILNAIQNKNIEKQTNDLSLKRNNNLAFCSNNKTLERQPKADKLETKNNTKKVILYGAIAALTLSGIAELVLAKGKHLKNIFKKQENQTKKELNEIIKENRKEEAEEKAELERQVKEYFEAEEKELALSKQKISESNAKNEQWLDEQHNIKEKEYSDFWNKKLTEKEEYAAKYNDIKLDKELSDDKLGNSIDLNWHLSKFKQSKITKNTLKECENLTFDTPNLKLMKDKYDKNNVFDLGLRYAIVANNTKRAKGSAIIMNEMPEIFKGINEDELVKTLDELPSYLNNKKINKFTISGENFNAEMIGSGCLNDVYKITDSRGNQVCYKYARQPYLMNSGQGVFNEIAIMQEAQKAGVTDIPKLYMANPLGCIVQHPDLIGTTTKGAWEIIEFVDNKKQVPQNGLKLLSWLQSKGLYHGDYHAGNHIGETIIDLGGICDNANTVNKIHDEAHDIGWLFRAYHNGKSTSEIIKKLEKYS